MIPKGTQITCPKCGVLITTTPEDLLDGTSITTTVFGVSPDLTGQRFGECSHPKCPGRWIGLGWELRTVNGWLAPDGSTLEAG